MRRPDKHQNLYENPLATLLPNYNLTIFMMVMVSNSLLVFFRKRLGYRLLQPWMFAALFGLLFGVGYARMNSAAAATARLGGYALMCFAALMIMLMWHHRRYAWSQALSEEPIHSMSRGDSHLAPLFQRLFVPEWIVQRWIEPLLTFAAGYYLLTELGWALLGWWLILSAICLADAEAVVLEYAKNQMLDIRDSRVEGQVIMQTEGQGKRQTPEPGQPRAGGRKPARLAPELERLRPDEDTITRSRNG